MSASAIIILRKSGRLGELLEDRIGVKGESFAARLHRARRILPREARMAGGRIAAAERKAASGGIVAVDALRFDEDYRVVLRYLQRVDARDVERSVLRAVAEGVATALLSGGLLGMGLVLAGVV